MNLWEGIYLHCCAHRSWASQVSLVVKSPPANAGDKRDVGLIPELGRSPGGGHGNLLQYSCLENPMDRRAWQAIVHRVTKNWTWLKQPCKHAYKGHKNVFHFCTRKTLFIIVSTIKRASLVAQTVKHLSVMQVTWVQSLGWEDPLEKEMAAHSSILAWKSHGWISLVGYCPRGRKELDMTERLHFAFHC